MSYPTENDVTNYLIRVRKGANLTQDQLAERLGAKQGTVSTWERGVGVGLKGLAVIERWAAACGGRAELVLQLPGEVPRTAGLLDAAVELDAQQLALVVRAVRAMSVLPPEQLGTEVEVLELKASKVRAVREAAGPTYRVG